LTKNFLSPSKKNYALGRILEFAAVVISGGSSGHSDPAGAGDESPIISHTQPIKQQPEMFKGLR
jgi:hypothetical protein